MTEQKSETTRTAPDRGPSTPLALLVNALGRLISNRASDLGKVLATFFAIVVVVAAGSAAALLVWPSRSSAYFSWDLGAASAAALIGGLYFASVIVFVYALTRPRRETLPLSLGVLALAIPTLLFTARHHDVFDWSRFQAGAWVILFLSAPVSIALELRSPMQADGSPRASSIARAFVAAIAIAGALLAGSLWFDSTRDWLSARSPVPIVGLTGAYLGAWCSFVSVTAAVASARGRSSDIRLAAVLVGSVAIGSLTAAARTWGSLGPNAVAYVAGLVVLGPVAVTLPALCAHELRSTSRTALDPGEPVTSNSHRAPHQRKPPVEGSLS